MRKENQEESLKQLNELVPVLSKRGKNLILFFPITCQTSH